MEKRNSNAEVKAGVKTIGKFFDKINPNTDYQAKVKRDIQYIDNELKSNDVEQLIICNKSISANYWYLLVDKGFTPFTECFIRQKGYDWNFENLKRIRNCLRNEMVVDSAISSVTEAAPEYLADKLLGKD